MKSQVAMHQKECPEDDLADRIGGSHLGRLLCTIPTMSFLEMGNCSMFFC